MNKYERILILLLSIIPLGLLGGFIGMTVGQEEILLQNPNGLLTWTFLGIALLFLGIIGYLQYKIPIK